jgi:PilZ domain
MEHRYSERIPVVCGAVFAADGVNGEGRVIDVSLPGCLMESPESVKVGEYVRLRLFLPDSPSPLNVPLAVVRRVEGNLIGLEFIQSSQNDQLRLTRFVRKHKRASLRISSGWEGGVEILAVSGA